MKITKGGSPAAEGFRAAVRECRAEFEALIRSLHSTVSGLRRIEALDVPAELAASAEKDIRAITRELCQLTDPKSPIAMVPAKLLEFERRALSNRGGH